MRLLLFVVLTGPVSTCYAQRFWIASEADHYPELDGWEHIGNSQRSLHDSVLTLESIPGQGDKNDIVRWVVDLGPTDTLVIRWRMKLEPAPGQRQYFMWSSAVPHNFFAWEDALEIGHNNFVKVDPRIFHDYEFRGFNATGKFDFYIDGALASQGEFRSSIFVYLSWGNDVVSREEDAVSHWDYVRFGVVRAGDMNCDYEIDPLDIEAFLTAIFDPDEFDHSLCNITNADVNNDGKVDAFDIEPFIDLLFP